MFVEGAFLRGSVGMGALPASVLLIDSGHAWVLILTLLVLCCGLLCLLSRPGNIEAHAAASVRSKRSRRHPRTLRANRMTPVGPTVVKMRAHPI